MKRVIGVALVLACAAAASAALAGAAQTGGATSAGAAAAKPKLPPLPDEVKQRGRWNIGIKCDSGTST